MVFQHSGAQYFDLGGGFHYSGSTLWCFNTGAHTTGALSPTFDRALRALGKHAHAPTTHDSTRYGLSRSSPRTFLAHHRAAISAAVVLADATTILLAAPAMSFKLTMGMSPF